MRYLYILAIWTACYFLPQYAGDWYDANFNIYQALISLFLLFAVSKLSRDWWVKEYGCLCVLQILWNGSDFLFSLPADHYNEITAVFNGLELFLILGCGGSTWLYRMYYADRSGSGPDSGNSAQKAAERISGRRGNA